MFLGDATKKMPAYAVLLAILTILITQAGAFSIGTAPGVLDLGEVNPGEDVDFTFYLVSNSPTDMLVDLSPMRPHLTLFLANQTGRYTFVPEYASNMVIENWVSPKRTPVLLSASKTKLIKLADGGVIRANGEAEIVLHVPKDAEPCYFISSINPSPMSTPELGGGMGVATIGITRFVFVFKVTGDAHRNGNIIDVMPFRESQTAVRFDVLFKNTGTCSVMAWIENLTLYNSNGSRMVDLASGGVIIPPNQIRALSTRWEGKNIKEGDYRAEARVQYYTGSAFDEKTVTILKPPLIKIGSERPAEGACSYPWWILILILVGLLLVYVFGNITTRIITIALAIGVLITLIGALTCFSSMPWTWFLLAIIILLVWTYLRR